MPEFLTTRGIASKIESIISDSKNSLFIVSAYLNFIPDNFIHKIQKAIERGVKVTIVFRDFDSLHINEINKLESIKGGLNLFQNTNLHAKAYFNEKEAVVTSFNLSQRSEQKNIEFGVYFTLNDSRIMFESLLNETEFIINKSDVFSLRDDEGGHCIRCNTIISFDGLRPLCLNCYIDWKKYNNPNYKEKYCHLCGEQMLTTFGNPFCAKCV
jgi:hypothetical protein